MLLQASTCYFTMFDLTAYPSVVIWQHVNVISEFQVFSSMTQRTCTSYYRLILRCSLCSQITRHPLLAPELQAFSRIASLSCVAAASA